MRSAVTQIFLKSGLRNLAPSYSVSSGLFGEKCLGPARNRTAISLLSSLDVIVVTVLQPHNRPHRRVICQPRLEWGFVLPTALPHDARTVKQIEVGLNYTLFIGKCVCISKYRLYANRERADQYFNVSSAK